MDEYDKLKAKLVILYYDKKNAEEILISKNKTYNKLVYSYGTWKNQKKLSIEMWATQQKITTISQQIIAILQKISNEFEH